MQKISRQIRVGLALCLSMILVASPLYVAAATTPVTYQLAKSPTIIITELQTNGGSASQEFIELYNTTDQDISFDDPTQGGWKIQFFNSTAVKTGTPNWQSATSVSNSLVLGGTISAHDYFILASTDYAPGGIAADQTYVAASSHLMTDTGGGLQLMQVKDAVNVTVHDRVMWLAATDLPVAVLAAPKSGQSLQRIPNDDGAYFATDATLTEFMVAADISPYDIWRETAPDPTATSEDEPTSDPPPPANDMSLATPYITELLPNPASPLTDADDEYIEIYNPNDVSFNLVGYSLQVGLTTVRSFSFKEGTVIGPLSYLTLYSSDTGISLSNSGSKVALIGPDQKLIMETEPYGTAADGQAWIKLDETWQWTTSPTPGTANLLAAPAAITKAVKTAATKTAKTTKVKAATVKKVKKVAVKKVKKVKAAKKKTPKLVTVAAVKPKPPIHRNILVAVAVGAVLYGLYEYRHDISSQIRKLGSNRVFGGKTRPTATGRRGAGTTK